MNLVFVLFALGFLFVCVDIFKLEKKVRKIKKEIQELEK